MFLFFVTIYIHPLIISIVNVEDSEAVQVPDNTITDKLFFLIYMEFTDLLYCGNNKKNTVENKGSICGIPHISISEQLTTI